MDRQKDGQKDGWKDRWNLFYRTLPAEARGPIIPWGSPCVNVQKKLLNTFK